jgi:23S rRNA (adenine2030-N6)-methyltransferase
VLSYQHAYHAGNHADVLKHLVLCQVLDHLNLKPKAWTFLDTHAGRGRYDLRSFEAAKTGDAHTGIKRLHAGAMSSQAITRYLAIATELPDSYPGSPAIASRLARPGDRLILCERHPGEFMALDTLFGADAGVRCLPTDGFAAIKHSLPPPSRRGAILIDPSYETADDYPGVIDALANGIRRFATGVFMIWYPRLRHDDAAHLRRTLRQTAASRWLDVTLDVLSPVSASTSLYGSGMFIVNPPYTLQGELESAMPQLVEQLGQDETARFSLDAHA